MSRTKVDELHRMWRVKNEWVDYALGRVSDENLAREVAPGRNHGVWILGHLIASDDDLAMYLGRGGRRFPEYEALFQTRSVLRPVSEYPAPERLRREWKELCEANERLFAELTDAELDEPHALIGENPDDDYFKTKRECVLNWAAHQLYHAGQLVLLVPRKNPAA